MTLIYNSTMELLEMFTIFEIAASSIFLVIRRRDVIKFLNSKQEEWQTFS